MYESKKNTGRKDIYKYQKSSHQKNFHNSTYFGYHKYNKYKQKYNHSNSIKDYDEETIFSQIFEGTKSTKKTDLKEKSKCMNPKKTQQEKKCINTKNRPTKRIFIIQLILTTINITNINRNIIIQIPSKTMMKKQYFPKFLMKTSPKMKLN